MKGESINTEATEIPAQASDFSSSDVSIYRKKQKKFKVLILLLSLMIVAILAAIAISPRNELDTFYKNKLVAAEVILEKAKAKGNKQGQSMAYINMGYIYYKGGDYSRAIVNFNRAIRVTPKSHVAYYWLGMSYLGEKNYDEARVNLEWAAENAPKKQKYLPLFDLGRTYEAINKPDEAMKAYQSSIKDSPQMWNPHANLAALYEKKGKHKQALLSYRRAYKYSNDVEIKKAIDRLKDKAK